MNMHTRLDRPAGLEVPNAFSRVPCRNFKVIDEPQTNDAVSSMQDAWDGQGKNSGGERQGRAIDLSQTSVRSNLTANRTEASIRWRPKPTSGSAPPINRAETDSAGLEAPARESERRETDSVDQASQRGEKPATQPAKSSPMPRGATIGPEEQLAQGVDLESVDAPKSGPADPIDSTGSAPQPCLCCVETLAFDKVAQVDTPDKMGHSFSLEIGLKYPERASADTTGGVPQVGAKSCQLEWWEKSNISYHSKMIENVWTDMLPIAPTSPTFKPWATHVPACGGTFALSLEDTPRMGKRGARGGYTLTRVLEIRVVVKSAPGASGPGCGTAAQQVSATQTLSLIGGIPDWSASSFATI